MTKLKESSDDQNQDGTDVSHTFEVGFRVDRKSYANARSIRNWIGLILVLYAFIAGLGFSTGVHVMKWLL